MFGSSSGVFCPATRTLPVHRRKGDPDPTS
jgi:hypothetical protein